MRLSAPALCATLFCAWSSLPAQGQAPPIQTEIPSAAVEQQKRHLLERVIANQKKDDLAQFTYERIERLEIRKNAGTQPPEVKISRAIPAGTGIDRIPVRPDGKAIDETPFWAGLEKNQSALFWAAGGGRAPR